MRIPSFVPRCPVCNAKLEGLPFPLPAKGKGKCPATGLYEFEAAILPNKVSKDKNGNIEKVVGWKISGGSAHPSST